MEVIITKHFQLILPCNVNRIYFENPSDIILTDTFAYTKQYFISHHLGASVCFLQINCFGPYQKIINLELNTINYCKSHLSLFYTCDLVNIMEVLVL